MKSWLTLVVALLWCLGFYMSPQKTLEASATVLFGLAMGVPIVLSYRRQIRRHQRRLRAEERAHQAPAQERQNVNNVAAFHKRE